MEAGGYKRLLVWVAVMAGALVWIFFQQPREPQAQGKSLTYWVSQLHTAKTKQALAALSSMGPDAVPLLLNKIRTQHASPVAEHLYSRLWHKLASPLQDQLPLPKPPDFLFRAKISAAISGMGAAAVPNLCSALDDPDCEVRAVAIDGLGSIGAAADPAMPLLLKSLERTDCDLRFQIVSALSHLDPKDGTALPALILMLKDRSNPRLTSQVQFLLQRALPNRDALADSVIPNLTTLCQDTNSQVRVEAAAALWRLTRKADCIRVLAAELDQTSDVEMCRRILHALSLTGPETELAVPAVQSALDRFGSTVPDVRALGQGLLIKVKTGVTTLAE